MYQPTFLSVPGCYRGGDGKKECVDVNARGMRASELVKIQSLKPFVSITEKR